MTKNSGIQLSLRDIELLIRTRRRIESGEARAIRERSGLSQSDIARAVGVTISAVSRWETPGDRVPRADDALRYGKILDIIDGLA